MLTYDGVHVPLVREELKGGGSHGELDDHLKQDFILRIRYSSEQGINCTSLHVLQAEAVNFAAYSV